MNLHPINVLIVDDQKFHNSTTSKALNDNLEINVVGTAVNDTEMYNLLNHKIIHVILLDIELPRTRSKDGIQISRELKQSTKFKNVRILCLSMNTQSHVLRTLLVDICVDGYLDKNEVEIEDITKAIKDIIDNKKLPVISLGLRKKVQRIMAARSTHYGISTLTKRERNIISYIAEGLTNLEISAILFHDEKNKISEKTVGKHRENIYQKLDCKNAAQVGKIYFNMMRLHSDDENEVPSFKSKLS